ncbi:hypothetical protein Q0590_32365 [Rhodocytophaga aerolata]|uniref:Class I SAM-dependent methyltransferase n=1 Tax=Rhodocytophaga aerolata TaxID=455078 RepID=A0ABT8RI12_9BACT|nr:hypothetical protein [Rhodocytophaga aerolata]MDO1451014.1 hypothetical protein [Rhodocytophaga aerolata]
MISSIKQYLKKSKIIVGLYVKIKGKKKKNNTSTSKHAYLLGMTTNQERDYFEYYGKNIYAGYGEIVDLGCWLGSTTIPLLEGLIQNKRFVKSRKKIHAYDIFIWESWMNVANTDIDGKYKPGDSFVDEFIRRTANYSEYISVNDGDLCKLSWRGDNIEFLLIDAMKSWDLANCIVNDFFPCLIENKSYILHQDFAHYYTPWIHLIQYKFREYFTLIYDVPSSGSTVFKYTKRIPDHLIAYTYSFSDFTEKDIDDAFDYSLGLVTDENKGNVYLAKVMAYIHLKDFKKASDAMSTFNYKLWNPSELTHTQQLIAEGLNKVKML